MLIIDLKNPVTKVDLSGVYANIRKTLCFFIQVFHNEESKDIKVYVVNINSKIDKMLKEVGVYILID